jgi:hypothetical protein
MEPGKHSMHGKDFYLKEYECLRREIEWLLVEGRSLERNVVIAIGVTWAWLLDKSSTLHVPKWSWFAPCLFSGLGILRAYGYTKEFRALHDYLKSIESAFSAKSDPAGWEHFAPRGWTSKSTLLFWLVLLLATTGVALYEIT